MSTNDPRVAVVTGANRGIGLEVVRQLAEKSFRAVLASRELSKGEKAAAKLNLPTVLVRELDVSDDKSVRGFADRIAKDFGRVDILINNAGMNYDYGEKASTVDLAKVHETYETNLFGAWRLSQALIPLMRKHKHGRIVNVSSESGSLASMGGSTPAYSASKAALNAFTRVLAGELKGSGILVNSVCPGWVRTDMGGSNAPRSVEQGAASVLWAALLPDNGPTGGFFRDGKPRPW
jgi:NAD(P)-dependent dehydrogenase (short-subunit alcohol dehydrogenase family)